jgi:hypothetical protein
LQTCLIITFFFARCSRRNFPTVCAITPILKRCTSCVKFS